MRRVVLVDDSKTVHLTAEVALKPLMDSNEIELVSYENPLELIQICRTGYSYELLITDVNMPQMNGLDLAKELKGMPHLALKPIVALTTESSEEKKNLAKAIGLAGWITKPFTADRLLVGVKRPLRLR